MRFMKWVGLIVLLLIVVYFLGPKPSFPRYDAAMPTLPSDPLQLEKYVANNESHHKIKPGNEARIVWLNDSLRQKTEYAVVYIHGFGASQEEGDSVHIDFAKKFGCNLYLARLQGHGIDTSEPMLTGPVKRERINRSVPSTHSSM